MAGAIIQASLVPEALRKERDQAWRNFSRPAAHRLGTEAGIIDNETSLFIKREMDRAVPDSSGKLPVDGSVIENALKVIKQAVNRLRLAVKDYQRLSFETEELSSFDFCKLVRQTVENTTDNLKQIHVDISLAEPRIMIIARRGGLAYVLEELLINAWKEAAIGDGDFVARGLSKVRARIEVKRDGDELQCTVCDNGPGIPMVLRDRLFHQPCRGRRGGTGLGLCIVDRILQENRGSIILADEQKAQDYSGACFSIKVPIDITNTIGREKVRVNMHRMSDDETGLQAQDDSGLQALYVLVVEDNPDLRKHLIILLEQHGINCVLAKNEYEAARILSPQPDMIIADIDLSEAGGDVRGGIVLAENLQQMGLRIPIILVSYDPWFSLPQSGSSEFRDLKDKLCVFSVLDRNQDSFKEDLIACVRKGIRRDVRRQMNGY